MKRLTLLLLVLIFFTGTFLRFYRIGQLPNSYTPDELAQGYTAYSFLLTGRDEWGSSNLLSLRSFGDFKPPLQTLLMIPSVRLFGLTPFAVRFPNALLSSLAILTTFALASILFSSPAVGLISAALIAFSPWHLPMSRLALEAALTVFLLSAASCLYLKAPKNIFILTASGLLFGLNLFSYHSARLVTPLYVLGLYLITTPKILRPTLSKVAFGAVFLVFCLLAAVTTLGDASARSGDIAIFNPTDKWLAVASSQYDSLKEGLPALVTRVFNNKATYTFSQFLTNYTSYFSPQFLLSQGAGETTYGMIPGFGVLGLVGTFGLICLAAYLIRPHRRPRFRAIIFLVAVILLAPVPAALAKGYLSANRTALMMPFIQILSALGLYYFITRLKHHRHLISLGLALIFILESLTFFQTYYFRGSNILSEGMLYGHREAITEVNRINPSQIIYSRKLSEPQAYVAFFNQYHPTTLQSHSPAWLEYQIRHSFLDQLPEYHLDKYFFKELNFPSDSLIPGTVLVGRPEEFPPGVGDSVIYYPRHSQQKAAIVIYQNDLHLTSNDPTL